MADRRVYADELVCGMWVVPPGGKRPVEIVWQLSDVGHAHYFEFACRSGCGYRALRLHRSETVQVVPPPARARA